MENENIYVNTSKDWLDEIVENIYTYFNGRKIVLWGKYSVSDTIRDKLMEKHGLEIGFYVDANNEKIDNRLVFPTNHIYGKSNEYYVAIPLAFYQSLKDELICGGYKKNIDYYYFADCIIYHNSDYYEDLHGNKIIGNYHGLKVAFSGFNSIIIIGENTYFENSTIYVQNNSKIAIGKRVLFRQSTVNIKNDSEVSINDDCNISEWRLEVKNKANITLNSGTSINNQGGNWTLLDDSKVEIGYNGRFLKGVIVAGEKSRIRVGNNLAIMGTHQIIMDDYTCLMIGDDCIISYDVILRGNDGHSIFDLKTGKNINSTEKISRSRTIEIGDHVWIGMRSIILYNTRIGNGSIIGAASLVKSVIKNNCIAVGIPARVKKEDIVWERENGAESFLEMWDYREKGL